MDIPSWLNAAFLVAAGGVAGKLIDWSVSRGRIHTDELIAKGKAQADEVIARDNRMLAEQASFRASILEEIERYRKRVRELEDRIDSIQEDRIVLKAELAALKQQLISANISIPAPSVEYLRKPK